MYKLKFSNSSEEDLKDIAQYIFENFGQQQSEKYFQEIKSNAIYLSKMPSIGYKRNDIPKGFLAYPTGMHLFIYQVNEEQKEVKILKILHSKMDFTDRL